MEFIKVMELIFITLCLMLIVLGVFGFISLRQSAEKMNRMNLLDLSKFMGAQVGCVVIYFFCLLLMGLFLYMLRCLLEENPLGAHIIAWAILGLISTFICFAKAIVNLVKASICYDKLVKKY